MHMDDEKDPKHNSKEVVARLIDIWIKRSGYRRQNLSNLANFRDYNQFYKAYLDMQRTLSKNAEQALSVVHAVTNGLPAEQRATLKEVLAFLSATQFPMDRLKEIGPLFTRREWAEVNQQLITLDDSTSLEATHQDIAERLQKIEAALAQTRDHLKSDEALQAEALTHFEHMPDQPPEPGILPKPYRMHLLRARLFTGRSTELTTLVAQIRSQAPGETLAITGLGGMGKTSLACEFVHRYGQFFRGGVFWLNCSDPRAIDLELVACGEAGLVQHNDWDKLSLDERVSLVVQAWQSALPRLLVFDGCEDEETLRRWRPSSGGCRAILTSRRAHWPRNLAVTLSLPILSSAESIAMLQAYRPDLQASPIQLETIAQELGYLPLGLHLAGSYLETYQHDPLLGDPLNFLHTLQSPGPLAHAALQGIDVAMSPTDHEQHVSRSFALIVERLSPEDELDTLARSALARAAFLASETPFTLSMLVAALPNSTNAHRAIQRLLNLGLLSVNEKQLRIHRLLADFVHAALPDPQAIADMRQALMTQAEQAYAHRDVELGRQLLPHVLMQAEYLQPEEIKHYVELYNNLPFLLDLAGDLQRGLVYLKQAHTALYQAEMVETTLGAEVLNNLAEWHRAVGDPELVRPLHEQALAIRRSLLPPEHLSIAESQLNLGESLREQGSFDQARQAYTEALLIAQRSAGPKHDIALAARNHLALLLFTQEHYEEARQQFEELISITAAAFGSDDPRSVTVHNNLASTYGRLGNYERAIQEFDQVVSSFTARMGTEHPDTLKARLNGVRARMLGKQDLEYASHEMLVILPLLEAAFGDDHPLMEIAHQTLEQIRHLIRNGGA